MWVHADDAMFMAIDEIVFESWLNIERKKYIDVIVRQWPYITSDIKNTHGN